MNTPAANPPMPSSVPPRHTRNATIEWRDGNVPISLEYDDPYFAREDGLGETRHVFLAGNRLPSRFSDRKRFQIGELGFGTGLNFFATLDAWRNRPAAAPGATLTYTSFEKAPLAIDDMRHVAAAWPELTPIITEWLDLWPSTFDQEVIRLERTDAILELYLGDANLRLNDWQTPADAWYLDGFTPARNPELWGSDLMNKVFARTVPGGTFATYTVAGWIRRNLTAAGFTLEKFPGHGRKRESLRGWRAGA
jgi:tRNA U34 5-methylaminomethyl-2-thiouridine-forming methyltransferase MnmC